MGFVTEMTFVPLLLVPVAALVWYAVNRAIFHDLLSPFSLLFPGWVLPLILQTMNLSAFEKAWTFWPSAAVVWATVALIGTCLIGAVLIPASYPDADRRAYFSELEASLRRPSFLVAFMALYGVVFSVYLYVEFITNPVGIPLIAALEGRFTSGTYHRWGKDSPWAAISAMLLILTPAAYAAYRANRIRSVRAMLFIATILFPAMAVLKLTRSDIFASAVAVGAVALLFRRFGDRSSTGRAHVLKLAGVAVVTVVGFYAMMGIRIANVGEIYSTLTGFRVPGSGPIHGLASVVYGYTALPFDNLGRFLSAHDGSMHLGLSVLRPFLSVSGLGGTADEINAAVEYPTYVSIAAENDTFLTIVYAELGLIGIAIVPIAYAALMSVLYARMRTRPSLANVLLYVNFVYPWLWLFFNNGFGVLSIYINGGLAVLLGLLATELRVFSTAPIPRVAD